MTKFGKYHFNALKISLYFFGIISVIILLVNIILYLLFEGQEFQFKIHLIEHLLFSLSTSGVIFILLTKDFFVKSRFSEIIEDEEKKYKFLFENAHDAILLIKDQFIIDCNLKSCEIFNCEKGELIGKSFLKLSEESKNVQKLVELIKLSSSQPQHFEWKYHKKDKESFDAEVTLNQVDVSGFHFIQVFIKDISELKRSQKAKHESEEKFKTIFNSVSDGMIIFTEDHKILEVNETVLRRYGLPKEEFMNLPVDHKFPGSIIDSVQKFLPELNNQEIITFEIEKVETSEEIIPLEMRIKKIRFEGQNAFIAVGRDITRRRMHQMATFNAVIEAEEKERSRVAKELHDGVSPILSTAKLYAQSLSDCYNLALKANILSKIESTIEESILSISEISNNLSPHVLQNFGLTAAVQSFVDKIIELKKIDIQFVYNWNHRLENNVEVTLYRVINELINNSLKHSEADRIIVNLNKKDNKLKLIYTDNGNGFDIQEATLKKKGMGLFNMVNRVKSLDGIINYYSEAGEGVKVVVIFQLNES